MSWVNVSFFVIVMGRLSWWIGLEVLVGEEGKEKDVSEREYLLLLFVGRGLNRVQYGG